MKSFDSLLHEAQSPITDSGKLWEIKDSEFSALSPPEIRTLIRALVDNPNTDEELLIELMREWPNQAFASTRIWRKFQAYSEMNRREVFNVICHALPALEVLVETPASHKAIINLLESELLNRLNGLPCHFDWKIISSHEISIDWQPDKELKEQGDDGDAPAESPQDFTVNFVGAINNENALLESPAEVNDIRMLFAELDANNSGAELFEILERHGWNSSNCASGDGCVFEIESVELELDDWNMSDYSISVDGSGTLCVIDPSGEEHDIDLPAGVLEHSFENYRVDKTLSLPDMFGSNTEAIDAFRAIVAASLGKEA